MRARARSRARKHDLILTACLSPIFAGTTRVRRLDERDVGPIRSWRFPAGSTEAIAAEALEPTAMTLATATPDGVPRRGGAAQGTRRAGLRVLHPLRSRKGAELDANPRAALVLYWPELERQVRVTGAVARVSREETVAYFVSRPFTSRLGAWASQQSTVLPDRAALERDSLARARASPMVTCRPARLGRLSGEARHHRALAGRRAVCMTASAIGAGSPAKDGSCDAAAP